MPLGSGDINEASEKQGLGCYFSGPGGIQGRQLGRSPGAEGFWRFIRRHALSR
jgi:hypothetical protein